MQDELTRIQERARWLENRIEQVLLIHRQSVLEGKRAKMAGSTARASPLSGDSADKLGDSVHNMVSLGKCSSNLRLLYCVNFY